jgi:hypothetical protein
MQNGEITTIIIEVVDGRLVYRHPDGRDAWRVHASRGDEVRWMSECGNFAVHFGERTPFEAPEFRGERALGVVRRVRRNAVSGPYKYFVALSQEGWPIVDDPEMLID